ncbi:MAG TPA: porin [Pirellulales bacterium]|nr:porin [Pirellulales bacterium]
MPAGRGPAGNSPFFTRLPPSPSQQFAEFVDREPLTSSPSETATASQPDAELAYWQSSTNEGRSALVQELEKRVKQLEDGGKTTDDKGKKEPRFEHQIFGRIQAEGATFNQDPANIKQLGNIPNGNDFRRVRAGIQGAGYDILFYRLEIDFVQPDEVTGKRPRITDGYFEIRELPTLGTFRIGQYREPYSVERLTSANDLTFIERGLPQAFHTSRAFGVMLYNNSNNEQWYWWTGLFNEHATNFGEYFGDAARLAYDNRLVWVPWYDEPSGGSYLAQLGVGYSLRDLKGRTEKFSTGPEVNLQYDAASIIPSFVSTGTLTANQTQIFQAEASTVLGPLSFQAEYYGTLVNQVHNPQVFFQGMYVYGSYLLTGEHRVYDRKQGIYTAIKPNSNFFRVRTNRGIAMGPGAWEVAARFSSMNLSDRNIQGGTLNDVTLGLNWYATFQMRFSINYIHAFLNRNNRASNCDVVSGLAQVVW